MKTINNSKHLLVAMILSCLIIDILSAQSILSPSAMPKGEKPVDPVMQKLLQANNERLEREVRGLKEDNERLQRDHVSMLNEIKKTKQEKDGLIKNIRLLSNEGQEREQSFQGEIEILEKTNMEQWENYDSLLVQIDDLEKETEKMAVLYGELARTDAKCCKLTRMLKEAELGMGAAMTDAPVTREAEGRLHYNRGVMAYKSKKIWRATREFNLALEKNPLDADAHYNLAVIYDVVKNDRPKAMEHYRSYLELNPKATDAGAVKNYIADLQAMNEIWGFPNCQNIDERFWPGRW